MQIVENTGAVMTPYMDFPQLLAVLLRMLHEGTPAQRKEVMKVGFHSCAKAEGIAVIAETDMRKAETLCYTGTHWGWIREDSWQGMYSRSWSMGYATNI